MAIEVRVSRGYVWRMIIIGVVCVVFGLWGVYDYMVAIPRDQKLADRLALLQVSNDALETEQTRGDLTPEARQAYDMVVAELNVVLTAELDTARGTTPFNDAEGLREALSAFSDQLQASGEMPWVALLTTIGDGLAAERRLPLTEASYPRAYAAFTQSQTAIEELGDITAPGKYDRIMQWAFISCLPCVPYFIWMVYAARRRVYRLDDAGTLSMPEGTWARDDIADIDMSRWMAKSIARVVHRDGTSVKLDDYKFRDLHRIIGSIAARLHPDDWDAEAKPIDAKATAEARTDGGSPNEAPAEQPAEAATASTDAS